MRVSEKMFFQANMERLQKQSALFLKATERATSGRRVNRASDDPVSATRILSFKKTITQIDQRVRNVDEAERFLSLTEEILKKVETQLHRASELAIDMSSGFKTALDRKNAVHGVQQILDEMVSLANTEHNGQYIFSGNKIKTPPFNLETEWKGQFVGKAFSPDNLFSIQSHVDLGLPIDPNSPPNEILNVSVDGVNIEVVLEDGVYTGDEMANEIQTRVNEHPAIVAAGASVVAEYRLDDPENPDTSSGRLLIRSEKIGGTSSITPRPAVGFKIAATVNDTLNISMGDTLLNITLTSGIYKTGAALANELKTQIELAGQSVDVTFQDDHFLITPTDGNPFVHPLPATLAFGDARTALGFIEGHSRLSGEEYLGDSGEMPVLIEPDRAFGKNLSGMQVFKGGAEGNGADIFAGLLNFKAALDSDDGGGIAAAITDMHNAIEQMGGERALVGARLNRVESTRLVLEEVKLSTVSFESGIGDIDLTQAISELRQQQNTLEITRAIAARVLDQPTLLNFLR